MLKETLYKKRNLLISIAVLLIVVTAILLPGMILSLQERQEYNLVNVVEDKYLPSSSAMARNASANLTMCERLRLAAGQWESSVQEAKSYEMSQENYKAIALAREKMKVLYDEGLYPADLSSRYSNWYTWTAIPYKAVDTTFHTYTAYYWRLRFEKYDGTETHTIWMLEDGTVFLAEAVMPENVDAALISDAADTIPEHTEATVTSLETMGEVTADELPYEGVDTAGLSWKALTQVKEEMESYEVLQLYGDRRYLYAIVP